MYTCECTTVPHSNHSVADSDEWTSLNSFRDRFRINGAIINKDCLYSVYDPEDVHAETLHMLLVERK